MSSFCFAALGGEIAVLDGPRQGRDCSRPLWVPARQQRRRRIVPCTAKRTHKPIYFPLVKIHKGGYNESGADFSCVGGTVSCIGPWGAGNTPRPAFYCLTALLYIPGLSISRAFCQNVALPVDTRPGGGRGRQTRLIFLHNAKDSLCFDWLQILASIVLNIHDEAGAGLKTVDVVYLCRKGV